MCGVCVCCTRAHTDTPAFPEPGFLGQEGLRGQPQPPLTLPEPLPSEASAWDFVLWLLFPKPSPEIDRGLLKGTQVALALSQLCACPAAGGAAGDALAPLPSAALTCELLSVTAGKPGGVTVGVP